MTEPVRFESGGKTWEVVRVGAPKKGERYVDAWVVREALVDFGPRPSLRAIVREVVPPPPQTIVLVPTGELRHAKKNEMAIYPGQTEPWMATFDHPGDMETEPAYILRAATSLSGDPAASFPVMYGGTKYDPATHLQIVHPGKDLVVSSEGAHIGIGKDDLPDLCDRLARHLGGKFVPGDAGRPKAEPTRAMKVGGPDQ